MEGSLLVLVGDGLHLGRSHLDEDEFVSSDFLGRPGGWGWFGICSGTAMFSGSLVLVDACSRLEAALPSGVEFSTGSSQSFLQALLERCSFPDILHD